MLQKPNTIIGECTKLFDNQYSIFKLQKTNLGGTIETMNQTESSKFQKVKPKYRVRTNIRSITSLSVTKKMPKVHFDQITSNAIYQKPKLQYLLKL